MKNIFTLILLILFASCAYAQKGKLKKGGGTPGTGDNTIVETINSIGTIKLNPAVELDMTYISLPKFTFSTINDYELGLTLSDIANIKVKSTGSWTLTVYANTSNFSKTSGSNTNMPCNVLKLKSSLSSAFQSVSITPISLATGTKGTNTKTGNFFSLSYQADPGFNYDGATYSIDLIYTLTAQ